MAKILKSTTKLTLLERVILPNILKKETDYKTLIINKDIDGKCKLTQDEIKKYEMKVNDQGGLSWNEAGAKKEFEIEFTKMEKLEIKLALQKLDEDKKLTVEFVGLYEKFVK